MNFRHTPKMVEVVGFAFLFVFGLIVTVSAPDAGAQIKGFQKISDTQGGFQGGLDNNERFGCSQTSLGDLDGDGVTDIAVGAYFDGYSVSGPGPGAVWVLFLNNDGTVKAYKKIAQNTGGFTGALDLWDEFGMTTASLVDLDGDGITDLAVGARSDDDGGENRGAVWVLFLNADGSVKSHQKISNTVGGFTGTLDNFDSFGSALAWLGDINDDGLGELAVGAYQDDDGGLDRGAVYILSLNPDGTVASQWKISSTQGNFTGTLDDSDKFGQAAAPLGDLDEDGVDDLAVGAFLDDDGGGDAGALWVLFLNADGSVKTHQKISATEGGFNGAIDAGDRFGVGVGWLGDANGDGFTDAVVGALEDDDGGVNRGAVWLLSFHADGKVNSSFKISGTQGGFGGVLRNYDYFGHSAISVGDLDNDGRIDVSVGASGDDDGGDRQGAVWVLFLSPCVVTPTVIDFDSVQVGTSVDTTFVITNTGSDTITGDVTGSCPGYTIVSGGGPFTTAPSESWSVTVRFEPTGVQTFTCTICTGVCADVSLTGVGVESPLPRIVSVADVGNDEGRQVRISLSRSGLDARGSPTRILQYEAYRRIDPLPALNPGETETDRRAILERRVKDAVSAGMKSDPGSLLLGWDYIGAVPAHGDAVYHMIAPTLADSTADDGIHWSVFFIRAATADPFTYFDSPPDSGYSVDNLAPDAPAGFSVAYNGGQGNELTWEPAGKPDFRYFRIYRGFDTQFATAPENLVHVTAEQTVETSWMDLAEEGWKYFYKITTVDFAGNESEPSSPGSVTGIGPESVPEGFALYQNTPNPFNPATAITYDVPAGGGRVTLEIYDVVGSLVRTLADRHEAAGSKRVTWDGTDDRGQKVGSGVYFYRLRAPGYEQSLKMMLLQ